MLTVSNVLDYIRDNLEIEDWMDEWVSADLIPEVTYTCVESVGGEGEGETYYAVWEFREEGSNSLIGYARFDGWYASYDGASFEDAWEVTPSQKTVTVYE